MNTQKSGYYIYTVIKLVIFIIMFFIALEVMSSSFQLLSIEIIEQIIIATSNPFVSFFIGLLVTAIVQSSSTTTTMFVIASSTIGFENAVFMVMGANVGTTVTSSIVSLGHVTKRKEFRKAIAAASLHDFFNILTAIILVPLEYFFHILSDLAQTIASGLANNNAFDIFVFLNPIKGIITPISDTVLFVLFGNGILGVIFSMGLLFYSIRFIALLFKKVILEQQPSLLEKSLFGNPFKSLIAGIGITSVVQSSSLVSSLIVPIVATNKLSLKRAFPLIMGTNIGTTITALFAAFSKSEIALSIAFTHVLFNVIGVLIFFPIQNIRQFPIQMARSLGKATLKNRLVGFAYIFLTFFIIPFILIYSSKGLINVKEYNYIEPNQPVQSVNFEINNSGNYTEAKFFYKQLNVKPAWFGEFYQGNNLITYQKGHAIYINKQKFELRSKSACWKDTDAIGNYEMCVLDILPQYQSHQNLDFKNCYIFTKKYSDEKVIHKFYLAVSHKALIKHEVLDLSGELLASEELIKIVKN